jgi:hypothetical protein
MAFELESTEVSDVEDTGAVAHGPVLTEHGLVLDRHLPTTEIGEAGA